MEKKISFGFFKQIKKPTVKPVEDKKQFIDCLEGNSIKVLGGEVVEEIKPLVIPLKEKDKTTTASVLSQIARGQLDVQAEDVEGDPIAPEAPTQPVQNESLDKMAEREIIEGLKKDVAKATNNSSLVVPVTGNIKLTGEKESTLEDYDNIPVRDFGMAMLRGMGWQPGSGMGKHNKSSELVLPNLRPKGMGLGADKVSTASNNTEKSVAKEELKLEKGAYVKIVKGKQNGTYGQISGFDEDSGRLIVKAAIGGSNINLNEHMVEAISKNEYQKMSKVINSVKYEEYKNKELQNSSQEKHKEFDSSKKSHDNRDSPHGSSDDYVGHRDRHRENHSHSKTYNEDQVASNRGNSDRSSRRDKYRRSHSRSSSTSPPRERDIDKKRKGKKKRRDKSRSRERRRH